jgi:hypothetical protein
LGEALESKWARVTGSPFEPVSPRNIFWFVDLGIVTPMDLKQRRPLVPEDLLPDHPDVVTTVRKVHAATDAPGGLEFILSDSSVDRMGDVIDQDGWDLANFKRNPIALFNHNKDAIAGRWQNLRVENGALRGHLELAPKGIMGAPPPTAPARAGSPLNGGGGRAKKSKRAVFRPRLRLSFANPACGSILEGTHASRR